MDRSHWNSFFKIYKQLTLITKDRQKSADDHERAAMFLFELLEGYEFDAVKDAMLSHAMTNKFMPTPSDVVKAIDGDPAEKAEWAWRLLLKAIETCGYYDSVRFPEPAFHAIVMSYGSWERISAEFHNMDDKDLQIRSHEFRRMYISACKTANWDNVPPYLVGYHERNNREIKQLELLPPVIDVLTGQKHKLNANTQQRLNDNPIRMGLQGDSEPTQKQ